MAFKMRSGNKPEFKNMGSSPVKMTLADQVAAKDAYYGDQTGTPTGETSVGAPTIVKSKKQLKKEAKLQKKQDKLDKKKERLDREAQERSETGVTSTEQLINRVGDWAEKKGKTRLGKFAKGTINTLIDPTSTDAGILMSAGKNVYRRVKDSITGNLAPGERLLTGEQGLLSQTRDVFRNIKGRKDARLMDPTNTSPRAIRYRKKMAEKGGNTVPLTKKKKY